MIKKFFLTVLSLLLIQNFCFAKDTIQFNFPNEGWHKIESPDGIAGKKCYIPYNQTPENYTEMLTFYERVLKNKDLSPRVMIHKQLGKDRTNYPDIKPEYIKHTLDEAIVAWCSEAKNTCAVERAFQGTDGVIFAIYINKAPHYSQNIFAQWSNILGSIKLYEKKENTPVPDNLIEL